MAWKITDLPVGTTPLTGGELFEMVQEGESYSVPVSGFAGLNHNTLSNIQGGIPSASEYYHLSQLIHDSLFSASPTIGVGINGQANMQVDYGNDHVSFYMDAGEGQGYSQIIDMDGDAGNSEINLGLQTEVYQQIGIGSAPNIRMRSGSDTWFYVDSDDQRLGNNTAGSTYFQANSSGEAWINAQGVRHFEADQENLYLGDKDAVSTATYIHINADNSIMDFYVHNGGILLHLDDSGTITLGPTATTQIVMDQVTGDFYWYGIIDEPVPTFQPIIHFDESSSYLKLGNQNHTYIYLREMDDSSDGSVRIYAADDIQLSPTNEVVIDIGGGVNEFTVDSAGVTLTKGVTIDEFSNDTTLSGSSPSAVSTEYAVKTYVDSAIVSGAAKIEQGNSSVEVIDVGTGEIGTTVDGVLEVKVTAGVTTFQQEHDFFFDTDRQIRVNSDGIILGTPGAQNMNIDIGDDIGFSLTGSNKIVMASGLKFDSDGMRLGQEQILWTAPGVFSDLNVTGDVIQATVDTLPSSGFGAALYMASDGNFDEADASAAGTMPCRALAVDTGTGTGKKLLLRGFIRDNTWTWTPGGDLYVSATTGALTQTPPAVSGDWQQKVGYAWDVSTIFFKPSLDMVQVP